MADGEQELQAIVRAAAAHVSFDLADRVTGVENIPATGGAILTPNHTSVIDSFFLPAAAPRPVSFVGKAEHLDDWKTRKLFPALGMIRSTAAAATQANGRSIRPPEFSKAATPLRFTRRALDLAPASFTRAHGRCSFVDPHRLSDRSVGIKGARSIQPPDQPVPNVFRPVEITSAPDSSGRLRFGERPAASVASDHR